VSNDFFNRFVVGIKVKMLSDKNGFLPLVLAWRNISDGAGKVVLMEM
jgi:hypothetical protein